MRTRFLHIRPLLNLLTLAVFIIFTTSQCKKNNPTNPIDQLPPETQTGANTFGCLIDGKVFIPKGDPLSGPIKKAQYQFINGKQGFGVSGSQKQNDGSITLVGLGGDSISLSVGIFSLTKFNSSGKYYGGYSEITFLNPGNNFYTNEIQTGQLTIKKFDTINQIVSGTFWFDAKNSNDQIVQIREGRFDLPYVR